MSRRRPGSSPRVGSGPRVPGLRIPGLRVRMPPQFGHAARVALVATLLVGVVYVGCVIALNRAITGRLVAAVDSRLQEHLSGMLAGHRPDGRGDHDGHQPDSDGTLITDPDNDVDEAPVFVWRAVPGQRPVPVTDGAPALPAARVPAGRGPATVQLGASPFRLVTAGQGAARLVAGQSLAEQQHVTDVLQDGEAAVAPVLLLAMFAGSLIIGLRALSPVEHSRRRQLEFTADASHELRTPLSVISAEIGIALSSPRPAEDYRATLHRIERESQRLRRIVEDLLWLARFDSQPPPPGAEPVRPEHDRRRVRRAVPGGGARGVTRHLGDGQPVPRGVDQRAAGVDRPADRGAGGQRLPVRRPRWPRPAQRGRPRQPGQPDRGRQRSRDPGRRPGPAVRPVPPGHRAGRRRRARAGHRRLDRAVHRGALADR